MPEENKVSEARAMLGLAIMYKVAMWDALGKAEALLDCVVEADWLDDYAVGCESPLNAFDMLTEDDVRKLAKAGKEE